MKIFHAISIGFLALTFAACPSDDKPDPWDDPSTPNLPETKLPSRDGIPSSNTMDRLLYFVSTHEDGPGLYAYRPSKPDDGAIYIDPDLDLSRIPFIHMLPLGVLNADGNITDYRAGGVMYAITKHKELGEPGHKITTVSHQYTYVSSDPATEGERYQVSSTEVSPGSGGSGLFSYDLRALTGSSFLQMGSEPLRFDLDLGADDEALAAPKGKVLVSTLGDDLHTHNQWLYINEDAELVFYTRDFSESVPVIDVTTNQPIAGVARNSQFIAQISYNTILVGLAFKDEDSTSSDDFASGSAYLIYPPDADNTNGRAERVENNDGEALQFQASIMGGLMTPDDHLFFVRGDTVMYAAGDGLGNLLGAAPSEDESLNVNGITLTRIEGAKWSRLAIRNDDLDGFVIGGIDLGAMGILPPMLIPVEGHGAFWAPNGEPELIEADSDNPTQWKRTPLASKLPQPEATPITESVNGWIYYNHDEGSHGGAVAYHVASDELIHLPGAQWIGASSNGKGIGVSSASRIQIAEVFVQTKDNILGAIEAAAPDQGIVTLGTLPSSVEAVSIHGPGMGPHRLMSVQHEDERFEVIAVDTTKKDSLKQLMDTPAVDWEMPFGELFDEVMTLPIQAARTGPVDFY